MAFLFSDHGAKILSNSYCPRSFGNAIIELEAKNVRFRIVKDRRDHEIRVDVAPTHIPDEWEMLDIPLSCAAGEKLSYIAKYDDNPAVPSYVGLTEVARLLKPRFAALNDAYSQARYEEMRTAFMNIHGEPWLTSSKLRPGRNYPCLMPPKNRD